MSLRVSFLIAVFALTPTFVVGQDKVFNLKNSATTGTISEMTPDKISIETPTGTRTFEVNEINSVTFGEEPKELGKIRTLLRDSNYESALSDVKSLDANAPPRDYVRQELQYIRAMCEAKIALATGGKRDEAINNLQNFFKSNPASYHFYTGAELLGDLATATGDFVQAARFYAAIGKAPWSDYKLRSSVLEGRALLAQGKYPEAQEKFDTVIASADSSADANRQKSMATVGKAVCMSNSGGTAEAIKVLTELIKNNDSKDTRLFGRAYNALGGCYLQSNQNKEALIQYLHVHHLFYAEAESHAEALHHLVKLWTDLQKSDRAIEMRTILTQQYGGSIWAKGI